MSEAKNSNPGLCLDTNVFIGVFSPDESTEEKREFLSRILSATLPIYGPSLVNFEVLKAASQKEKSIGSSPQITKAILEEFFDLPILLVWNKALVHETLEMHRQGISNVYDASFLALAKIRDVPLVTEDRQMIKRGRKLGVRCLTVKEWMARH